MTDCDSLVEAHLVVIDGATLMEDGHLEVIHTVFGLWLYVTGEGCLTAGEHGRQGQLGHVACHTPVNTNITHTRLLYLLFTTLQHTHTSHFECRLCG